MAAAFFHYFRRVKCSPCGSIATAELHYALPEIEVREVPEAGQPPWTRSQTTFSCFFICSTCRAPSLMVLRIKSSSRITASKAQSFLNRGFHPPTRNERSTGSRIAHVNADSLGVDLDEFFEIVATYPNDTRAIPADLPIEIDRFWKTELVHTLHAPTMSVMACRKVLETMCDRRGAAGTTIQKKIESLVKAGTLTKDMGDWAHTIRQFGNEAAHEDGLIDREHAREIYEFTSVLAELLYSFPGRIARLRASKAGQ